VRYISSQEDVLSLEAWTVTPGGVRIPLLPSAIRDREEDNSGGAAEFSDTKVKAMIFPRVEVGSLNAYKLVSKIHTAPYPGEFSRSFVFNPSLPFGDWEARFVVPEARKLYIDKRGVAGGLDKTVDGLSYYSFHYRREKALPLDPESAGPIHFADYLFVSTMPDMLALGRVAKTFFEPNVEVTDEIRALALRLSQGAADDRARVRAL
jgi:hypothetical protein